MNALKCCFNWRVVAGLGAIAVGIGLLYPGWLARLGPLLIYAICPLSMLAMMWAMGRIRNDTSAAPRSAGSLEEPMVTIPASLFAVLSATADHHRALAAGPELPLPALPSSNEAATTRINEVDLRAHAPASTVDQT